MTTADPAAEGKGVVGWEGREDRLGNATEQGDGERDDVVDLMAGKRRALSWQMRLSPPLAMKRKEEGIVLEREGRSGRH
ncbi:uncharacterized protein K444DRAFT_607689, partial [Hyaloscypha bicolor E]